MTLKKEQTINKFIELIFMHLQILLPFMRADCLLSTCFHSVTLLPDKDKLSDFKLTLCI